MLNTMEISSVFDGIERASFEVIKPVEGDYILDGLLYCGKCRTPKQCVIDVLGTIRKPMCLCKCESERLEAEEAERKRQEELQRIAKLRNMGFPDDELRGCTFTRDDGENAKISQITRKYVDNFDVMRKAGKGLIFYGSVGAGKTFYAACIANALIDKGYPCLVTNFARLVNTISGMYDGKQEYIDGLNRFALLVIDDLATERDTEFMNEIITNIIDARYRSGKPLIITTNLTAAELKNPAEIRKQRIYSRLLEMCIPVEVSGKDRRKQKLARDYKAFNELLGL